MADTTLADTTLADTALASTALAGTGATGRHRRGLRIVSTAASVALVAAIFGFALPHVASYGSAWASIQAMTWPHLLFVVVAAAASMVTGWMAICSVLPAVRLRQAAVVNLGSTAAANTLPAGGAVAMGISWAMLSGWGVSAADYVLYSLVSGLWNVFAKLALPVIAVALVLVTATRPQAGLLAGAVAGLGLLVAVAVGFALLLRSESFARRASAAVQPVHALVFRLARRPQAPVAGSLLRFRERAAGLLAERGWRISAATTASNLALWLVLLASIRGVGLSQSQVPWQMSLAAFALVRLVTVLPVTPGGSGVTELGLVGVLAAGNGHQVAGQVTASVLLYRAVTYLVPIPAGALACVAWRYAPALRSGSAFRR